MGSLKIIIRTENDAQISDTIRKYIKQKILDIRKYVRDDGEIILTFSANEEGMNIVLEADFMMVEKNIPIDSMFYQ